jgi:hypothetical protein
MENSKATLIRDSVVQILRNTIKEVIPNDGPVPPKEIDALSQLCMMSMIPTGEEDPKTLMRSISDPLVNHLIFKFDEIQKDPVLGKIAQFFLIEWCHRNDHLNGDWAWKWDGPNEGHVSYNSKTPLEDVVLPIGTKSP